MMNNAAMRTINIDSLFLEIANSVQFRCMHFCANEHNPHRTVPGWHKHVAELHAMARGCYVASHITVHSRGDWWVVIYTACESLAKWWGCSLAPPTSIWKGGRKIPPLDFLGSAFPPGITNNFKKIESLKILNGFERSIHLWIGKDIYNFTKIAAILNFHVNMPPYWILCVFGLLKKKLFSSFVCVTAQYVL